MNKNECSYNLLYEPWIRCVLKDNTINMFGLVDFNRRINDVIDISIPKIAGNRFPFYELAFYRLVINLYSVALNISPWDDRNATNGLSNDNIDAVEQYLVENKEKFDIMDDERPFIQCTKADLDAALIEYKPSKMSFVTSFVHLPSENAINCETLVGYNINIDIGNTKEIVDQIADKNLLHPSEAVYHLLYLNTFAKCAGAAGCSSISSTPELYVIFMGETLGQTIQMNLITNAKEQSLPIWERDGVISYYQEPKEVDCIGYAFYPNRFCRFEWDEQHVVRKILYAPHNFTILNDTSKNVCRSACEQYYQSCDRDALIKIIDDKNVALKYNRTENWLTMLMSAVINDGEIPESSLAAREIFSGSIELPTQLKIVLYGRSADGKSGVYKYSERLEEQINSEIFKNAEKRAYITKYIRFVREQFAISKKVVNKYYKLQNKVNAHVENKVPFINQCISLYAHKRIEDIFRALEINVDTNKNVEQIMKDVRMFTKNTILNNLSENVLCATRAYNLVISGGSKK